MKLPKQFTVQVPEKWMWEKVIQRCLDGGLTPASNTKWILNSWELWGGKTVIFGEKSNLFYYCKQIRSNPKPIYTYEEFEKLYIDENSLKYCNDFKKLEMQVLDFTAYEKRILGAGPYLPEPIVLTGTITGTINKSITKKPMSNLLKKLLDKETRILMKAGYLDSKLRITDECSEELEALDFIEKKAELVKLAKKKLDGKK